MFAPAISSRRLRIATHIPDSALEACAHDADVGFDQAHLTRTEVHYKSILYYISCCDRATACDYVVKTEPPSSRVSTWSPKQEFEGLEYVRDRMCRKAGVSAIRPIACGQSPAFLVTEYAPGTSLRGTFHRAIHRRDTTALELAANISRRLGRWLHSFREAAVRPVVGRSEEDAGAEVIARAEEIEVDTGMRRCLKRASRHAARLTSSLTDSEFDLLGREFPCHGDLAIQNVMLGDSNCLIVLDLENFGWRPLNIDLFEFRRRLEHEALRGRGPRRRAQLLWSAFLQSYSQGGEPEYFMTFCYMSKLFAHLAWLTTEQRRLGRHRGKSFRTRLRECLWVRDRCRWLKQLPADPQGQWWKFTSQL